MSLMACAVAGLALMTWLLMVQEPQPAAGAPEEARLKQQSAIKSASQAGAGPAHTPSINAKLASGPSAASPKREAHADWSKVVASMSLADVLLKAEASTRPDDRRSAVWALAVCTSAKMGSETASRAAAAKFSYGDSNPEPEFIARTAQKMLGSGQRMLEFCGDLDAAALRAALDRVVARSRSEASASHTVLAMRGSSNSSQWSQEQMQAVQLVLSNPQIYPRSLDHLLEQVLSKLPGVDERQLTMAEQLRVRSTAYQLMSGDQDPDSVRNLHLCFSNAVCGVHREGDALTPDQQRLMNLAQGVVAAIRTQRWDAFGM